MEFNFIEITLCHGCSPVNLLHIFRTHFPKNNFGGLFLYSATSRKERTPTQVFSGEFCEVFRIPFLQNTSRQLFLFYGKLFYQQNSKEPSEKRKKSKQLVRKTTTRVNFNHYLHQVFISYSKISLIFSQLPMIYWKQEFSETMQSYWGFVYQGKILLSFGLEKMTFSVYDCNNNI